MVSKLILIGAAGAVMGLVTFIFMVVYISSQAATLISVLKAQNTTALGPLYGNTTLISYSLFSYNNSKRVVESAVLGYNFQNSSDGYAVLRTYSSNPIRKVYLVNTGFSCFECFSNSQIFESLYSNMAHYGMIRNSSSLSMANLSSVGNLSAGSILIIPSGLMPSSLIPGFQSGQNSTQPSILSLLSKGDVIIYVGDNFSRSIKSGITYFNSQGSMQDLANANLTTTFPRENQSVGANVFYFNSSTFSFKTGKTFGTAVYKNYTTGTIVAFPGYPQAGWPNANVMGIDLANALRYRFWMNMTEESNISYLKGPAGSVALFTTKKMLNDTPDIGTIINNSYSILTASFFNRTNFVVREMPFRLKLIRNGTLSIPGVIGENQTVPISISINASAESSGNQAGTKLFHLDIYNGSHGYEYSLRVGFFNTSLGIVTYNSFILNPGNYTAYLRDSNNRVYGSALFSITPFYITYNTLDFANGIFKFKVINNNVTGSNIPYNISINHEYLQSGVIENGTITYTLPQGSVIPYGNETIYFNLFGMGYYMIDHYSKPIVGGISPIYLEFGIAAFFIIVLNLLVKDPNRDEFFIDVPAFPPVDKTVIKVSEDEVINIFNSTNHRFGWNHMPLSADEVKAGINYGIKYDNMPITVTSANASELLYRLSTQGKVENILSYFMPKRWNDESGHDIKYLVIFRRIHDFAVKNAMIFTNVDKAGDCDMLVTNRGMQKRIYFYSETTGTRKIKTTAGQATFLVFLTSEEKAQFSDKIYNTYSREAERIRTAIESSSLVLIDTENLRQLTY